MSASGLIGSCTANNYFLAPLVVILSKKPVILPKGTYGRDMIFLLYTEATLLSYLLIGTIYWYMAILFPIIYITYGSVCVWAVLSTKRIKAEIQKLKAEKEGINDIDKFSSNYFAHSRTQA